MFSHRAEALCCQPQKGPEPSERLCEADAHGKRHPQISGGASVSNAMSLKAKIRNIAKQKKYSM